MVDIGTIVSEDDSTLRANCRSSKDEGEVEDGILTPRFLVDPSDRVKYISRTIFKLVK